MRHGVAVAHVDVADIRSVVAALANRASSNSCDVASALAERRVARTWPASPKAVLACNEKGGDGEDGSGVAAIGEDDHDGAGITELGATQFSKTLQKTPPHEKMLGPGHSGRGNKIRGGLQLEVEEVG